MTNKQHKVPDHEIVKGFSHDELNPLEQELLIFRTISDRASYGTAIAAMDGSLVYSNESFAKMLGYDLQELLGKNIITLHQEADLPKLRELLGQNANNGGFSAVEVEHKRKDGSKFPTLLSVSIICDNSGVPRFKAATIMDITSIKQTEKALKQSQTDLNYAQEIAGMGSWHADYITGITTWSENYYRMIGFHPNEIEPTWDNFISLVHPDDVGIITGYLQELQKSKQQGSFDFRMITPGGTTKWIQNNVVPFFSGEKMVALKGTSIDITEKKISENKIRQQNERLNAIVTAMPDLVFVLDSGGTILELFSNSGEKLMIPAEEVTGTMITTLFERETGEMHMMKINECITSNKLVSYEYSIHLNNSPHYFEARHVPLGNGKVLTVVRDITEAKHAEIFLKNSEAALNYAQEITGMGSWEHNLVTNVMTCSDNYYNLLGVKSHEQKDHLFEHFLRTVHPEDIHLISSIQKSSFTENQSKTVNLRIILPGGIIKWLQTDIKAIYDQGVVVALKGVSIDITEKRKAEEYIAKQNSRLNSIISAMPDLIFVLDKEGVYREVYCSTPEILLIPPAQIVGTSMFSVFDEEMASMHHQYLLTCLNEKRLVTYEYTLGSKDDLRYYESRLAPVEEDHVLSLVRDITVTKHAEAEILNLNASLEEKIRSRTAQLAETNDQLLIEINQRRQVEADLLVTVGIAEKANNAKSEFLSRMSHELRTPMNAILGYAQLMNMGELTASQKKGVDYILKSGRHLLDLVNEVLDIAGIEAGRITLALKPVMVTEILSESIALILPLAKEKEITISVIPSADMNLSVLSDRQRLNQVMINLLDNAIKYNRINGQITILTERITRDGVDAETVRISITDTGIGIAGGDLDKLFNPFERLGAENTYIEGTGLGLAVVKRLLEAMNGKIGVISDTDAGSTFWIELPLGETRLEQEPKQQDHPVKSISASDYTGTIMYIEDNLSNIDLIDQILMTARPNVRMISNMLGKYAVELAMEHKPDVIFLDLNLPDTDGFEVMKLLLEQEKTRNIPVVIISADAMPHQITLLLEAGADNYFTKPIDIAEFLKEVDKWVGK